MSHRQRHFEHFQQLDPELREEAVKFLRGHLEREADEIRSKIESHPEDWWARRDDGFSFHFSGGMAIRNLLRSNGFSEKDFGVDNLDDYYVAMVELAVMGDEYFNDLAT